MGASRHGKGRSIARRVVIAGGAAFLILGIAPEAGSQAVRIEKKDSVTIVRNPSKPVAVQDAPTRIRLVPELTIGSESDPEETMIFAIRAVQVDTAGNIYILDSKVGQVKAYGPDGKHIRTFGRKGQGPGELQNPSRMVLTRDQNLCFLDPGNSRISIYSPDGTCLKETPMTQWRTFRFLPDSKGFGYGDILDMKDGVADVLIKLDAKLDKVATVASLVIASNPNERMLPIEMFRLIYQVDNDDRIVWASTGDYALNVVDPEGRLVKKIVRDFDRASYGKAEKDKLIKDYFGGQSPPTGAVLFFPPHRPILYYFIFDDEGRAYVRTYEPDGRGGFDFNVFDAEGRYFARFSLPGDELLAAVRRGKAYTFLAENKDGIPQVKRYAIVWEK